MNRLLGDRTVRWLAALMAGLVAIEALFARHHRPVFPWHHLPGYAALIGLLGCVIVVLIAKALGKWFLQRPAGDDD